MIPAIELATGLRCVRKLYESCMEPLCKSAGLSLSELDVMAFLLNNSGYDTARDVTEYHMLPKANVSFAVDTLIKRGLLARRADESDRRVMHLAPTERGERLRPGIRAAQMEFEDRLFQGFVPEETAAFIRLSRRIAENAGYCPGRKE